MGPISKKVAQGNATREALITVAREEFGARGYSATAIADIVERADVTKGAFYHHFSCKKELFRCVFENVERELSRAAFVTHVEHVPFSGAQRPAKRRRFLEQSNAEVWEQLVDRCRRYIELRSDPQLQRIVLVDALWVLSWEERQDIEQRHGVVLLRADLRRAMRRGIVQRLPLRALSVLLAGALSEACILVANADDRGTALGEAMTVVQRLLEGLRSDNAEGEQ
jgi:AcrR family transcriptional regulator